jgi:hypothetical protein
MSEKFRSCFNTPLNTKDAGVSPGCTLAVIKTYFFTSGSNYLGRFCCFIGNSSGLNLGSNVFNIDLREDMVRTSILRPSLEKVRISLWK